MATLNHIIQNGRRKGYSVSLVGRFAFLASIAALLLFSVGCEKEENFSDIPEINYISYKTEIVSDISLTQKVLRCTVKFEFKDGDGDVGDTLENCFFSQFNKINGVFVLANAGISKFIIPIVEPYGSNKQQKGTISVGINLYPLQLPSDTIKYRFYIKDRALHSSDTIETTEIVIDRSQKLR